ncbi:MAG TPA: ribosome biogenesis GTPase YlqF [Lentisphaeria bacterium]|nr:ribosome biogenesis GTPase YlqF [Lentisphaeria bacterium]|tara:strand:- start:206 stop:1069 length:864 start_codon:yes stop_codon:yes gene_type:complete
MMDFDKVPKVSWFPGHMNKALRQLREKLSLIDIVIEVLDARLPLSTCNHELGDIIQHKARMPLLFKADLANRDTTAAWRDLFKGDGYPVIATHYRARDIVPRLLKQIEKAEAQARAARGTKYPRTRAIRAMIVGLPNVGKSSLINLLVSRNQAKTGPRPGVTRHQQWIKIGEDVELMDTPGIMYPHIETAETALKLGVIAAIKPELVGVELLAEYLLHVFNDQQCLDFKKFYGLDFYPDFVDDLLDGIGRRRGMLLPGDEVDRTLAASTFLNDFREGNIGTISLEMP